MFISIITINRNNAKGLESTLRSTVYQTCQEFEHIIVDGASTDGSVDVIRKYAESVGDRVKWLSEPDKGVYNAMNKGIAMTSGDYVQFLNSGDSLASNDVVERMMEELMQNDYPPILYGNMLKQMPDGKLLKDNGSARHDFTLLDFYIGTLNHSSAYIKRDLFDKYGRYDEDYRIVSDWKWFTQAIVLGGEKPVYTDIDVSLFDMNGISETNKELAREERRLVLEELIPAPILADYKRWTPAIRQMRRIERYPWAKKLVWFLDRVLFKWEKHKR
jgi:glycosyltransferase involved in cell wall biosynthesis